MSRTVAALLGAGWLLLRGAALAVAGEPPPPAFQRVDALAAAGRMDAALELVDSLLASARASGASWTELEAMNRRGWFLAHAGRLGEAEADLREAVRRAAAARDTVHWCSGLRTLVLAQLDVGRTREAAPLARRLLLLARARRDPRLVAVATGCEAYLALLEGRYARARSLYAEVIPAYVGLGVQPVYVVEARVGLARALTALGRLDAARSEYQSIIDEERQGIAAVSTANALNNLANIEMEDGDPATAVADWRRALPIYDRTGSVPYAIGTRLNLARSLAIMGRLPEAAEQLEAGADSARAHGDAGAQANALETLAEVRNAQDRPQEGLDAARRALAEAADLPAVLRVAATLAEVESERRLGHAAEARSLTRDLERRPGPGLAASERLRLEVILARLDVVMGEPRQALERLDRHPAPASAPPLVRWQAHYVRACACARLGRTGPALAELDRATQAWERWRSDPSDPQWRESRGEDARYLYGLLGGVLMAAADTSASRQNPRRVFDALQRFKARTLEERMCGPRAPPGPVPQATLAWMQSGGLKPGELFLDLYAGDDSVFAFAISRRAFRVVSLHAAGALFERARRGRDLLATDPAGADALPACDAAEAALGEALLGGVSDLVVSCRRLIVCPDGTLADLPFAALALRGRALVEDHEVVVVPSASVLMRLRRRPVPPPARSLLALAGGSDAEGRPLAGASREVGWLEREFARVRVVSGAATARRAALLDALESCEALHVAAHVEVNPVAPWRSGLLLGGSESTREQDVLRASAIAQTRMHAGLAVLASCQSYGSQDVPAEGVIGLSTAFLGAGVPSVVCTLWPVSDEATAAFMQDYYRALGEGETASAALRAAQLAARGRPATRHPFYWAGFLVVGEPEARLALRRRG